MVRLRALRKLYAGPGYGLKEAGEEFEFGGDRDSLGGDVELAGEEPAAESTPEDVGKVEGAPVRPAKKKAKKAASKASDDTSDS